MKIENNNTWIDVILKICGNRKLSAAPIILGYEQALQIFYVYYFWFPKIYSRNRERAATTTSLCDLTWNSLVKRAFLSFIIPEDSTKLKKSANMIFLGDFQNLGKVIGSGE